MYFLFAKSKSLHKQIRTNVILPQSLAIGPLLTCCIHYPQHMASATWSKITTGAPANVYVNTQCINFPPTDQNRIQSQGPPCCKGHLENVFLTCTIMNPAKNQGGRERNNGY